LLAADLAEFLRLRKQLLAAGVKPVFLFGGSDERPAGLTVEAGEGGTVCYATAFAGEPGTEAGKQFAEKYQEKFQAAPDVHAVLAYEGVQLLFDALRRSKLASVAKVREELAKSENVKGVTGDLAVTKERTVRRALHVVRVENGKTWVARTYTPGGK
jgi:branched-chain amino acid transport system substrate-binding protein